MKKDLKQYLGEEWHKIDSDYTKKLVRSIPARLKAIFELKRISYKILIITVTFDC